MLLLKQNELIIYFLAPNFITKGGLLGVKIGKVCGRLQPAESVCCGWRQKQMHTDYNSPVEKKGRYGTLLRWESYGHFSQGESTLATLSRGEHANPCLDRLLLFLSGLIIYDIECCCLHFRYNQEHKNNKCRRESWRADYAPSLGKFIQALEITLKIVNKHLLFQTRLREF